MVGQEPEPIALTLTLAPILLHHRQLHVIQARAFFRIEDEPRVEFTQLQNGLAHPHEHLGRQFDTGFDQDGAQPGGVFGSQVRLAAGKDRLVNVAMDIGDISLDVILQLLQGQVIHLRQRFEDVEVAVDRVGDAGIESHGCLCEIQTL